MHWKRLGEDRWSVAQSDGSTNYIRRTAGRLLELHVSAGGATLHEYVGAAADEASPLSDARHVNSAEMPQMAGCDEAAAWRTLGARA